MAMLKQTIVLKAGENYVYKATADITIRVIEVGKRGRPRKEKPNVERPV